LYGKAQALDVLADQKRSNEILQKAIATYFKLLDLEDVPDPLFEAAAERCINRLRFMGIDSLIAIIFLSFYYLYF
jgi:aspartate beta-hydroxylase